jgi:hypothetical protein
MAKKKEQKLLSVKEYAATRIGWRGFPVNESYVYRLIQYYERGEKTAAQIGFTPVAVGKGYVIQVN